MVYDGVPSNCTLSVPAADAAPAGSAAMVVASTPAARKGISREPYHADLPSGTTRSRPWFSAARQPGPLPPGPLGHVQPAPIGIPHTSEIPGDPRAVSRPRAP